VARKVILLGIAQKILFSTYFPKLYVCSHALVANSFPNWIIDMGASKHIVRDRAGSMDFHCCPLGSQYVVLENNDEEDVLGVGTYKLTLRGGNKLLLFNTLYAPGVRVLLCSLVSLMKSGYGFSLILMVSRFCMVIICLATLL